MKRLEDSDLFTNTFLKFIQIRCLIKCNDYKYLQVYAVSPPLVPEKPFDLEVARRGGYYNFPPTGSMYLCASIDSLPYVNVDSRVIDLNNLLLKEANFNNEFTYSMWSKPLDGLSREMTQLIFLVSYMFGTTKECYIKAVNYIRDNYPQSLIVTGGVQATFDSDEILDSGLADIVCLNEGELQVQYIISTVHGLITSRSDGLADEQSIFLDSPPGGIRFLFQGTKYDSGQPSPPMDFAWDLSKYYEQIQISDYFKHGGLGAFSKFVENLSGKKLPYSAVLTKRGCRAHCAFCTVRSFNGKGLRLRSLDSVIQEIRYLYNQGIRHIDWLDDDLLFDENFNLNLFKSISDEFPDLLWTASNGLIGTAITPDLMEAMASSGLVAFKIGVESGNSEVIKNIRKPTTLRRLLDKTRLFRKYSHIFFSANFILGFPSENFSQMMDTFSFARKLSCDWASFYVCQPLKGTDLYSSFQHLMDPRAKDESYIKTINPGRSAARGEFAYSENEEASGRIRAGWSIFDLNPTATFDQATHNEIWFTFNLVANFLDNPCYLEPVSSRKLRHWMRAIHQAYPFDASMTAALTHIAYLLEDEVEYYHYQQLTEEAIRNSSYWQMRVYAFPELLKLSHFTDSSFICQFLEVMPPKSLIPPKYLSLFSSIDSKREAVGWKD